MQQGDAVFHLEHPGDGGNVIDRAGLIVDHHERDEDRVRPQRRAHALERDGAGAVRLQARDLVALFFQKVQRLAHRVVLHGGADDVFPAAAHVPRAGDERPVVALGAAGCEIHLVRLAAERFRDLAARLIHGGLGLAAELVGRARVAKALRHHIYCRLRCLRADTGRCGIVQINHDSYLDLEMFLCTTL